MNSIKIVKSDITKLKTTAIVNAANENLARGGGVCGAIFEAAGIDKLEAACRKIGSCDTGSAEVTPKFNMGQGCIIHAVGPRWIDGKHGEPELLRSAYQASLRIAGHYEIESIGFPLISAGIFGYPEDLAWKEAITACRDFLDEHPNWDMQVVFAVRSDEKLALGKKVLDELAMHLNADGHTLTFGELKNVYGSKAVKAVYFHRPEEINGFLSNWYPSKFRIDKMTFTSIEQYIMYSKCHLFGDLAAELAVMDTDDPSEQKKIGRKVNGYISEIWEGARQAVLMRGLAAKFTQNPELRNLLVQTKDAWLVECAGSDKIWACGRRLDDIRRTDLKQWEGKNILGFALMETRSLLQVL